MKKILTIQVFIFLFLLSGCSSSYNKYELEIFDAFDTVTSIVIYDKSESAANEKLLKMKEKLMDLHREFDRYSNYENINNVKTINDNAGIKPIRVSKELYYLLEKSIEYNENISDKVNILMGNAVDTWTEYRDLYNEGYSEEQVVKKLGSSLPNKEYLSELKPFMNVSEIELNEENQSVYLPNENMKLDLGACAKGYAVELLCEYAERELDVKSGIVSAGGNLKTIGEPVDKENFKIAIQNPDNIDGKSEEPYLATLNIKDNSVVTSGDYQRYFTYKGKKYCHIIDPETLMPADKFRSVTVIEEDSFLCDYLSTALFLMSYEDGLKLCEDLKVDAIWYLSTGEVKLTKGAEEMVEHK